MSGGRTPSPTSVTDELRSGPETLAVGFARVLRLADMSVPVGDVEAFVRALGAVGLLDRDRVYWAGRATLVHRPEDIELYDRAFETFWLAQAGFVEQVDVPTPVTLAVDDESEEPDGEGEEVEGDLIAVRYSRAEVLAERDFSECSAQELAEINEMMSQIRFVGARRRSRRQRRSRRARGRPDLRRTVRAALRTGGDPIHRRFTEPDTRPRRIVLLVDVSGSMEPYARALLRFAHVAVAGRGRVEAFTFGTRLTRVTRELSSRDPDGAMRAATGAVRDWSGGTRIGETLTEFNQRWGVRGMARGAIVVVLSDGWDRGDPAELGEQMARLHRVTHRLVWVNPLKHTPGYAPLARGMAAALPHVDSFIEGHSFNAVRELAHLLDEGGASSPVVGVPVVA